MSKLLDALNELGKQDRNEVDHTDVVQHASFEDDGDVPGVNEQLQQAGADAFNRFQRCAHATVILRDPIVSVSCRLSGFLGESTTSTKRYCIQILSLFTISTFARAHMIAMCLSSAADLRQRYPTTWELRRYPGFRVPTPRSFDSNFFSFPRERGKSVPTKSRTSTEGISGGPERRLELDKLNLEDFPQQLELFASDLSTFSFSLNEFPEFTDKAIDAPITAFEDDLRYWASCLIAYEGKLRSPAVQRYLHELMTDVSEHLSSVSAALSMFIEVGIPTIRFAQQHVASNFLNLSTIATFFSAVTATTLQYSYQNVGTGTADAVNAFWFTSMVFSIAAAVNSLLGLTWRQSVYRSPGHHVPWWVLIWLKRSPLVFLVLSVACFSIGLVLFTYSSRQNYTVSVITTVFTAFSSFGLVAVSMWFIFERWVYARHRGSKWLRDSLDECWVAIVDVVSRRRFLSAVHCTRDALKSAKSSLIKFFRPHTTTEIIIAPSPSWSSLTHAPSSVARTIPNTLAEPQRTRSSSPIPHVNTETQSSGQHLPEETSDEAAPPVAMPARRARFVQAIRSVIVAQQGPTGIPRPPPNVLSPEGVRQEELLGLIRSSRVARLAPKLRGFAPTQEFAAHQALVRHLQFSPNGKFLATSSWDNTSAIFSTNDPFSPHRTLSHPSFVTIRYPTFDEARALYKTLDRCTCRQTIDRNTSIHSVRWLPGSEAFMSVEGTQIVKLDLTGRVLDTYHFERLAIHDVSITPDGLRLLGFGSLLSSGAGLKPSKCRAEKQIIVYNLDRRVIETHVPLLHSIRDITLSRSGHFALISYEPKVAPQLWKLVAYYDWEKVEPIQTMTLSLRHTYIPKTAVDFAGPSSFGGRDDELVLCAGKSGDIHIWDRESASYLHHIRAPALGGDMTCIAWNPAAEYFMFATGSHDGTVQMWTTPGMQPRNLRPTITTTTPRTEVSALPRSISSIANLAPPILPEPGHLFPLRGKQNIARSTEQPTPIYDLIKTHPTQKALGVSSRLPSKTLASRRHSWA
ncbi:WD40 repeat-like protein [Lactarius indigo]|nr:WD40 repeat-like protein [Lactarius indigo]